MPKQITSWSYSRFSQYQKCPASAKYKFLDKIPDPGNDAMQRGNDIHKMAEDYVKGSIKKLPKELQLFKHEFEVLKNSNAVLEQTFAFTKDWNETVWNDWQGCAVRIKTDAYCLDEDTLYIIDHKTGKERGGYEEQLELYALGGMLKFPHVNFVNTQLWYLDSGKPVEVTFPAKLMPKLRAGWDKKVKPMLNDTRFAPKPGNHCTWCPYSKKKNGPCKF